MEARVSIAFLFDTSTVDEAQVAEVLLIQRKKNNKSEYNLWVAVVCILENKSPNKTKNLVG